jgi:hypothetical protein
MADQDERDWYPTLDEAIEHEADKKQPTKVLEVKKIWVKVGHHSPSHIEGWSVSM